MPFDTDHPHVYARVCCTITIHFADEFVKRRLVRDAPPDGECELLLIAWDSLDADAAGTGTAANPDLIQFNIPTTDPGYKIGLHAATPGSRRTRQAPRRQRDVRRDDDVARPRLFSYPVVGRAEAGPHIHLTEAIREPLVRTGQT